MQQQPETHAGYEMQNQRPAGYGRGGEMMPRAGVDFGWFSIAGAGLAFAGTALRRRRR